MKKALVIDDSPANLKLARMSLENAGFDVLEAASGLDGLKLAMRHRPEVIFLDIQMPNMNGVEVLKKIKATPLLSTTTVIAVTARSMAGDRENFLSEGFDGYLSKPISINELVAKAKESCADEGSLIKGNAGG